MDNTTRPTLSLELTKQSKCSIVPLNELEREVKHMSYNPYGGLGSIVVTPRKVHASDRRLGTIGARLTDTKHGKAVRRTRPRHAVTTNRPKVERVLPTLDEATQERLIRELALAERESNFRASLPSVHIDAND